MTQTTFTEHAERVVQRVQHGLTFVDAVQAEVDNLEDGHAAGSCGNK